MRAHVDHQTGQRRELIDKIAEETGTEDQSLRVKRLAAGQVHEIYEQLTNKDKQVEEGRAWHIRRIMEKTGTETGKSMMRNNVQVPATTLKEWLHTLQQQQ